MTCFNISFRCTYFHQYATFLLIHFYRICYSSEDYRVTNGRMDIVDHRGSVDLEKKMCLLTSSLSDLLSSGKLIISPHLVFTAPVFIPACSDHMTFDSAVSCFYIHQHEVLACSSGALLFLISRTSSRRLPPNGGCLHYDLWVLCGNFFVKPIRGRNDRVSISIFSHT